MKENRNGAEGGTRFLMFIMKNSNREGAEGEKRMKYGLSSLDSPSFFALFAFAVI
jgi:hypothetical protein